MIKLTDILPVMSLFTGVKATPSKSETKTGLNFYSFLRGLNEYGELLLNLTSILSTPLIYHDNSHA